MYFGTNKIFNSADNKFSFKILDEDKQLVAPDYKLIAKFDLTKSGYLKCLSARILDEVKDLKIFDEDELKS